MQTDFDKQKADNIVLEAKNAWLTNVNNKMLVMIKNAADVLEEYERQVDLIRVELTKTKQVYSELYKNLKEALDEHPNRHDHGLREPEEGDADAERGGPDALHNSDSPDPFGSS